MYWLTELRCSAGASFDAPKEAKSAAPQTPAPHAPGLTTSAMSHVARRRSTFAMGEKGATPSPPRLRRPPHGTGKAAPQL